MYKNYVLAICVGGLLSGCNGQPSGVGSYIYSDADTALMMQITSIDAGRIDGSLSIVTANEGGETEAATRPVSGTIEANALNMTVENGTGLSLVTGTMGSDDLRLTFFANGESSQITLKKGDASKFGILANGRRQRAAEKLQEAETAIVSTERIKQRSKIQDLIDQSANSIFDKSRELQEKYKKTEIVMAEYRVGNARMAKMHNAKQTTKNDSVDYSYHNTQLDYQIDSVSNEMKRVHDQVKDYKNNLDLFLTDAVSQTSRLLAECAADKLLNCSRLNSANQDMNVKYQQFKKGYGQENAAYKAKRS